MSILVMLEHDGQQLRPSALSAIHLARALSERQGGTVRGLLIGDDLDVVARDAARYLPVVTAFHPDLAVASADRWGAVIVRAVQHYACHTLIGVSNTTTKDVVAHAAGHLGGYMASDVVAHAWHDDHLLLTRPMYAGAVLATVELLGQPRVITIRGTAYPAAVPSTTEAIESAPFSLDDLPRQIAIHGQTARTSQRPDVADARIVVSGGRALKSSADFEQLVGGLADALGGGTGSSRALVDAGITPNELQVGQTGKIIAPDLYLALGISGAVQHLAGMKNAKVIVAINQDADAPIFEVANYGWVTDIYQAVPALLLELARDK